MKLLFWRHKQRDAELDEKERQAAAAHRKNVSKIVQTREKVDTLNEVLKQNNITLQLAKAIGHR